jgi:hypothetical protein
MDVSIEVHCASCGSANYSLPSGMEPGSVLMCNDCGRNMGSIAHLKDEVLGQVAAHSAEALRRDLDRGSGDGETPQPA